MRNCECVWPLNSVRKAIPDSRCYVQKIFNPFEYCDLKENPLYSLRMFSLFLNILNIIMYWVKSKPVCSNTVKMKKINVFNTLKAGSVCLYVFVIKASVDICKCLYLEPRDFVNSFPTWVVIALLMWYWPLEFLSPVLQEFILSFCHRLNGSWASAPWKSLSTKGHGGVHFWSAEARVLWELINHYHVGEVYSGYQLFLKPEKCCFQQFDIQFLRYNIFHGGIAMDEGKVTTVKNWLTKKELQCFLGYANFYRWFIHQPSLSKVQIPVLVSLVHPSFHNIKEEVFICTALLSLWSLTPWPVCHGCLFFWSRCYVLTAAGWSSSTPFMHLLLNHAHPSGTQLWHWKSPQHPFIIYIDHKNLQYLRGAKKLNTQQGH